MRERPSRVTEKGGVATAAHGHQENTLKVRHTAPRPQQAREKQAGASSWAETGAPVSATVGV